MKYKNKMKRAATFLLTAVMAITTMLGSTGLTAFAAETYWRPRSAVKERRFFNLFHRFLVIGTNI